MPSDLILRSPPHGGKSRVRLRRGDLDRLGSFARLTTGARRVAIVSDARVAALYGARALESCHRSGLSPTLVVVPPGERSKAPRQAARLWDQCADLELERADALIALGGGVVGDLTGFVAATWLRGIAWVCVPTSLLAQVDSSIGGKTGIDLARGKNLVGAFHHPAGVLIDPETLATLPKRQLAAGMAEVVKAGMVVDRELFGWIERHMDSLTAGDLSTLSNVIGRAVRAKARVVSRDDRERPGGARTSLNYGHTVAHALEAALGYRRMLHGEAVAIGMRIAADLSERVAGLSAGARARQDALLDRLGLPSRIPQVPIEALLEAMRRDKKRRGGDVRWVLTTRVGHASVPRSVSNRLVRTVLVEAGAKV